MGHLLVGNLNFSPPSPGNGSTSAEGTPQKIFLQYPCPVCEKGSLAFVVQGQCCFFCTDSGFIVCPFWEIKNFPGVRVRKFLFSRENSTAEGLIFRRFISTNTFENLAKSYMFSSKRYYFLYFRKSSLIFPTQCKEILKRAEVALYLSPTQIWLSEIYFCQLTATNSKSWNWSVKKKSFSCIAE